MNNAKLLAEAAARASLMALQITPEDSDRCAPALKLAVYHLRSAAKVLREAAEFRTQEEEVELKPKL